MEPEKQNVTPVANQGPVESKSKKPLYILIGVIVIVILAKFVIGGIFHAATGADIRQGPGGATTYTTKQGSVTVGVAKLPENWPTDVPKYPNAEIQSAMAANPEAGQAQSAIVFSTSDNASVVADFYKKGLSASGWKVEQTITSGPTTAIVATKDSRNFGVSIVTTGEGKVMVTAGVTVIK